MLEQGRLSSVTPSRASKPVDRFLSEAAAHRAAGRFGKARRRLQSAVDLAPHSSATQYELGALALLASGPGAAIPHFVAAVRAEPSQPAYWLALATALLEAERVSEARLTMERLQASGLAGDESRATIKAFVDFAFDRGRACYDRGDYAGAEALLDIVVALDETRVEAIYYAGVVATRTNRIQLAFDLFRIAVARDPDNAVYVSCLGTVVGMLGDHAAALALQEKAVALAPDLALAHHNMSDALRYCSRYGDAVQHAREAIRLQPNLTGAYVNLGLNLQSLGQLPEAIDAYDRALELEPTNLDARSNQLMAKLYCEQVSAEEYLADARTFGAVFSTIPRRRPSTQDLDPHRKLRIGFVSGDLRNHAVNRFLGFLTFMDRARYDLRAYMTYPREDAVSEGLRGMFDGWRNVAGLSDDAVADVVEADAIDILVDLSGHTAHNRLLVFARKPAPIQVTWIGLPATTGLSAIDYRLTDAIHDVPGPSDRLHTETLWRLPGVSATYQVDRNMPAVRSRPPFEDNGYVTFGVFNRFDKVSDEALRTWSRILHDLPDCRLFMVVGGVDTPEIRVEVEQRLRAAGLPLERVRLQPRVNSGYFELYHEIDIALDTFPYNGGTTSCDTLCMGVPFIALHGTHAASRTGVAVLTVAGLGELAGETPDDYAERALALARDRDRLRSVRCGLRERMFAGPLTDHARLAAEVGDAFRAMWTNWTKNARAS
jgi:protein O-GlcNAc transferase